jgi:Flp pilus assembly pilin Flp
MTFVKNFWKEEAGQDLIEYSLLLAFMCLFGVASYQLISTDLGTIWTNAKTATGDAATASAGAAQ